MEKSADVGVGWAHKNIREPKGWLRHVGGGGATGGWGGGYCCLSVSARFRCIPYSNKFFLFCFDMEREC